MDSLNNYTGPRGGVPPVIPFAGINSGTPVIPKLYWDAYDDEQRIKLLWKVFGKLAELVNQLSYYYIPTFDGGWSATKEYPPLTVVSAPAGIEGVTEGDSYTALKWVPVGTPLTNTEYWALTGNYNAQVAEVQTQIQQVMQSISNKVWRAPNVTAAKAVPASEGDTIITQGYYTPGDGGGSQYEVTVSNARATSIAMSNGLYLTNTDTTGNILLYGAMNNEQGVDAGNIINNILSDLQRVYVPSGVFYMQTGIVLRKERIVIDGDGYYKSQLRTASGFTGTMISTNEGSSSGLIGLNGVTFNYNSSPSDCIIDIANCYLGVIKDCAFTANGGSGYIRIGRKDDTFNGESSTNTVSDCVFQKVALYLIGTDNVVDNNSIWANNGAIAAVMLNNATNTMICNNQIVGTSVSGGIRNIANSNNIIIRGNYFDGSYVNTSTMYGVQSTVAASGWIITDNLFWQTKNAPIYLTNPNGFNISGNNFRDCNIYDYDTADININGASCFANMIRNNVFFHSLVADTGHSQLVSRTNDRPAITLTNTTTNNPSIVTGNILQGGGFSNITTGTSNVMTFLNNSNLLSSTTNGVQTDVLSIYRSNSHTYLVGPDKNPIELV